MKTILTVFAVLGLLLGITACDKKEDTTLRDASLLYLIANQSSGLSTEQQQASTAASAATGATSSISSGSMSAMKSNQRADRLFAAIMQNGMDPLYIRERGRRLAAAGRHGQGAKVVLAAFPDSTSGTSPNRTYNYSGSVNGVGKKTSTMDLSAFVGSTCTVSIISSDSTTPTGTATFTGGKLVWSGSGSSGSFTGTSANTGTVSFSGFGTFYTDWFAYIKMLQSPPAGATYTGGGCTAYQTAIDLVFGTLYKYVIIKSGDMTYDVQTSYAGSSSSSTTYSSNTDYSATMNSTSGIVMQDQSTSTAGAAQTVTMENTKVAYVSNFSVTGGVSTGTVTGSMSLALSGKVNGVSIDQTYSVSF